MKFKRITFTIDSEEAGMEIASELLDRHWIACAQVTEIRSHYRWEGKLEHWPEWKFDLKTTLEKAPEVCAFIQEAHPYKVPEILAEDVESVNPEFSAWIEECVIRNAQLRTTN